MNSLALCLGQGRNTIKLPLLLLQQNKKNKDKDAHKHNVSFEIFPPVTSKGFYLGIFEFSWLEICGHSLLLLGLCCRIKDHSAEEKFQEHNIKK